MRGHSPITIDAFNGLYNRGDAETCPTDHFSEGENFEFKGTTGIVTRRGLGLHQNVASPLTNILRIYNFITQDKNTLLVLTRDGANGKIYHVVDGLTVLGPVLTIAGMDDFCFVPVAGRAYISPFKSYGTVPNRIEKGLQSEFLYVYMGDGTTARKAAGAGPTAGSLTIANGTGATDAGFHLFGVVYEFDTGYLSPPARFTSFTTSAAQGVSFSSIPVSPSANVTARRIVATKVITNYNGDTEGYQYFFIPTGRIPNNTATTLSNISFYDADLLEDASHLIDNYTEIPAGACMGLYHGRLCLGATYTDISIFLVSEQGEPEAINQVDGLLIAPLDGNPVTQVFELRDVMYGTKRNRTFSWVDNGDVPASWPLTAIDFGLGSPVHGVSTVVDSGSGSVDYAVVATYRGICLFNGRYIDPELSWKIFQEWLDQDQNEFRHIQLVNDTINKKLYCALPDTRLLMGDYANGFDYKKIRWTIFRFDVDITTVGLVNMDDVILGAEKRRIP